ncbi:MAG: hypothetical protein NTV86_07230 [Planctomycetota bacterium]|nr:hypothetical protein [Planctomycetota bacterium]
MGYGHWLPNDPRGSLSKDFRNPSLAPLGQIHHGRKEVQPSSPELNSFYAGAKARLPYPILWFNAEQRQTIGEAIGNVVRQHRLTCYACAVLSDHVHLLIRRHRLKAQEMIPLLMTGARESLLTDNLVPASHPVWSCDPYVKYKNSVGEIRTAIAYVERNLVKHRIGEQIWEFVVPYDGWPHSKP